MPAWPARPYATCFFASDHSLTLSLTVCQEVRYETRQFRVGRRISTIFACYRGSCFGQGIISDIFESIMIVMSAFLGSSSKSYCCLHRLHDICASSPCHIFLRVWHRQGKIEALLRARSLFRFVHVSTSIVFLCGLKYNGCLTNKIDDNGIYVYV